MKKLAHVSEILKSLRNSIVLNSAESDENFKAFKLFTIELFFYVMTKLNIEMYVFT